ncbi:MAG: PDZ domain-containing protein [Sarcina sp.]
MGIYEIVLEYAQMIMNPIFFIGFILYGLHFYKHNKKVQNGQEIFIKGEVETSLYLTVSALVFSFLFGFLIFFMFKIINKNIGIETELIMMFIMAMGLKFFSVRFMCFSYSGSFICGVLLLLGKVAPSINLQIEFYERASFILILVGIIHFIEGLLVVLDGARGVTYFRRDIDGEIYGGFGLYRRWFVPILSFFTYIGYSSTSFTMPKKDKVRYSGGAICTYGILLIIGAVVSRESFYLLLLAISFMFAGHEFMIKIMFENEFSKEKIFVSNDGISVLDCVEFGEAKKYGIESGDKITHVNNVNTNDMNYLFKVLESCNGKLKLTVKKFDGKIKDYTLKLNSIENLGLILVPTSKPRIGDTTFDDFKKSLDREMSKI